MSRRKRGLDIHGVVLLDKPAGISSNRALQRVRGIFQARKAGHTGNLDPFATGMLPICLGEASKTAAFMLNAGKRYRAIAHLGKATTTGDVEGEVIQTCPLPEFQPEEIQKVFEEFTGEISQVPPMYSALKHEGKPLYEYARAGIHVDRPARKVTIHQLNMVEWQAPRLTFDVHCSKGTYIRTLAEDIATRLKSCAHLVELHRASVEPFESAQMVTLEQLQVAREEDRLNEFLLPVDIGLLGWPKLCLNQAQQARFIHGNHFPVATEYVPGQKLRVYGQKDDLLGLAELTRDGDLRPKKVFNL